MGTAYGPRDRGRGQHFSYDIERRAELAGLIEELRERPQMKATLTAPEFRVPGTETTSLRFGGGRTVRSLGESA